MSLAKAAYHLIDLAFGSFLQAVRNAKKNLNFKVKDLLDY